MLKGSGTGAAAKNLTEVKRRGDLLMRRSLLERACDNIFTALQIIYNNFITMNFYKYKIDFATLTKGHYLTAETLLSNIIPLELEDVPSEIAYLNILEYKHQIESMKEQASDNIRLLLSHPFFETAFPHSQALRLLVQEIILKFKLSFDLTLNHSLQHMLSSTSNQQQSSHHTQSSLHSSMYSDCYLFRFELDHNRLREHTYYTLLATLHCMLMQQPQLFDASLLCIEPDNAQVVTIGFALRNYQQLVMSQFYKRRESRGLETKLDFSNVDRVLTNEVAIIKQHLRCKQEKLLLGEGLDAGEMVERVEGKGIRWESLKQEVYGRGVNVVSMIAKINERVKGTSQPMYASKKLQLQKGNYPNEEGLLNGLIFSVLTSEEIYTPHGTLFVVIPQDSPDSDDFLVYLIFERTQSKSQQKPLDLNKKSQLHVELTQIEILVRSQKPAKKKPALIESFNKTFHILDVESEIDAQLHGLTLAASNVAKAFHRRAHQALAPYQQYLQKVRSYTQQEGGFLSLREHLIQQNWNLFYTQGHMMPFSKTLGVFVKEMLSRYEQIGDIFENIQEEADQQAFIRMVCQVVFEARSIGEEKLAEVVSGMYIKHREKLWAQWIILEILQHSLLLRCPTATLALKHLSQQGDLHASFTQLLSRLSQELAISPLQASQAQSSLLYKHPCVQTLFLITPSQIQFLYSLLVRHYQNTRKQCSEALIQVLQNQALREYLQQSDSDSTKVIIESVQQGVQGEIQATMEEIESDVKIVQVYIGSGEVGELIGEDVEKAIVRLGEERMVKMVSEVVREYQEMERSEVSISSFQIQK